ncbi:phosphoribosyltransferase [[Limnothrix rosea] IAM M-220]|uniref:phosphoribosyltransferase n=1 Tax=[Limnothrix rosea] IAM M-220 TaxID=454133 RepID=UPI00095A9B1F|nr:phosphoribosyltransferase family protein [[Limnothrix rosea] IAM M-220]OKH13764.1 phosphoribosyltransferase [[Limnothrix rosea] IAM M-220]
MVDRVIDWVEYHQTIEKLATQIQASKWEFNQILCLAKGGLRVGDILARIFDQPLAILNVRSYGGSDNRQQGKIEFAEHLTNFGKLGDRLLLVDDLVDSGVSIEKTMEWLKAYAPEITEVKVAVLWYKANSQVKPDYFVEYLENNPWIQQPFEHYEQGY